MYLLGNLLNKATPFLLLPILTVYLTPSDYGVLSIFQVSLSLIFAACGMSLHLNITKSFFIVPKVDIASLVSNCLLVLLISCLVFLFVIFVMFYGENDFFGVPISWLLVIPFIAFFNMCIVIAQSIIRNLERPLLFVSFEASMMAVNVILSLFLIIIWGLEWEGRAIGILAPIILFAVLSLYFMLRTQWLSFNCDMTRIKSILKVSVPLLPHAIASMIITVSDRFFISEMVGNDAVGIYTVGYSFGMVVALITDAFIKAWSPWFYKNILINKSSVKIQIVRNSFFYIIGLCIFVFIYAYMAEILLPYVIDERYFEATDYLFGICFSYLIFGIYQIFFPYLVFANKTHFVSIASISAAIVNVILNFYFIPIYSTMGAVYSSVIAYSLSTILVVFFSLKSLPMPWLDGLLSLFKVTRDDNKSENI